jgi:hypothetical protein
MKIKAIVLALILSLLAPLTAQAQELPTHKLLSAVERLKLFADKDRAEWEAYVNAKCAALKRVIEDKQDLAKFQCPTGVQVINVASGVITPERKARVKARLLKWAAFAGAAVAAFFAGKAAN